MLWEAAGGLGACYILLLLEGTGEQLTLYKYEGVGISRMARVFSRSADGVRGV